MNRQFRILLVEDDPSDALLAPVEDRLKVSSPGALAEARFGAVTYVHRFGSLHGGKRSSSRS